MGAAIKAERPSLRTGFAGCSGKKAFDSRHAAGKEGLIVSAKGMKNKKNRAYQCEGCGKFHFGTPSNRLKRG